MNKRSQPLQAVMGLIASIVIATTAAADTPAPMVELGPKAQGLSVSAHLDARGSQLRGTKLIGQYLRNANFSNCDLAGVVLEDCNLSAANFHGASLRNAVILDCNLSGADFSDAVVNEFGGGSGSSAALSDSQLRTTKSFKDGDLSNCEIQLAPGRTMDFRGMNLYGAVFRRGDFSKCQFEGATLRKVDFGRCRFSLTELRKSKQLDFQDCRIHARFVDRADFTGQNLSGSKIGWIAPSVKMDGADISGCHLYGKAVSKQELQKTTNFKDGHFVSMVFLKMDLTDFDFSRQNLTYSAFSSTIVEDANFTDAVITGVRFVGAQGLTAEQIRSTWNFKNNRMQSVTLSPELLNELNTR